MGYRQIAFTFGAEDFHRQIATILTDGSQLDLAELQKIARQYVTSLDGHSNDALDFMRYDPEWFEIEPIEDSLGNYTSFI